METFEEYLVEARANFCAQIDEQDWNVELRMVAESFLIAYDQTVERYKQVNHREVTKSGVINFQDALIQLYETEKEGTTKFNLLRDSYKNTIKDLKSQL